MTAVVDDLAASGALTAVQATAQVVCGGRSVVAVAIAGTFVATLIPEATIDGANWFAVDMFGLNGDAPIRSDAAVISGVIPCAGYYAVRLRCSAYTSGTANVALNASAAPLNPVPTRQAITVLASAARTALYAGADIPTGGARAVEVVVDVSVIPSSNITITIKGKDPVSGNYYTLLAGAAISTVSTNVYRVGPGLPATANVSANANLPENILVSVAVGDTTSITYSIGATLVP